MARKPNIYFSSDWHLGHKEIINFERYQFKTIEEHDVFLLKTFLSWAMKWGKGSTLYFLGDFGDPDYLWIFDIFKDYGHIIHFLKGNHDGKIDDEKLSKHVDFIHKYPIFLSHKLVISHFPVNVWTQDSVNICGHLHSAKLNQINWINANIHVHNYTPVSMKEISSVFSKIGKFNRKFLQEPYADQYVFTQKKEDCVYDKNGKINLEASRKKLEEMKK